MCPCGAMGLLNTHVSDDGAFCKFSVQDNLSGSSLGVPMSRQPA
jgi:hypothetical protein